MSNETKTIILTLDPNYVNWSVDTAIRDLIQNAIDAEKSGCPMTIEFIESKDTLWIKNQGAALHLNDLLLGHSNKRGNTQMIGQWGEGLKLSALGLVRAGKAMTIFNNSEKWVPHLHFSETFQQDVLAFDVGPSDSDAGGVVIEVAGITIDVWVHLRGQFLMYETNVTTLSTPHGEVLLEPRFAGRIYVGGILVESIQDEKFTYGYNMNPGAIEIDRDRKMTSRWDLKFKTSQMWIYLADTKEDLFPVLELMLQENKADISYLSSTYLVSARLKQRIKASFQERFGERAYPVMNQDAVQRAHGVGRRGMVFGESYTKLLVEQMPTLAELEDQFQSELMARFEAFDLTPTEQGHLFQAWSLVTAVLGTQLPEFEVVEFRDKTRLGLCERKEEEYRIFIGRNALVDLETALQTVMHESCHAVFSMAHDQLFLAGLDKTWAALCLKVWNRSLVALSHPMEAERSRPEGVAMIGLDVHDDIAVERMDGDIGPDDATINWMEEVQSVAAREKRIPTVVDEAMIESTNDITVGTTIHGHGQVVKVYDDEQPTKKQCQKCEDNFYNCGGGGSKECWSFACAVVVDKIGYSSIYVEGGVDTKMVKTLDCWHAVSK